MSRSNPVVDDEATIAPLDPVPPSLARSELAAPTLLAALGVGLLTIAVLNFLTEVRELSWEWPPLAALLLGLGLSAGLMYGSYRLRQGPYAPPEQWVVAGFSLAGGLLFLSVMALTIVIRTAEGRAVGEPVFGLYVSTGSGAIAGLLVGAAHVRARRDAARAERARDRLAFLDGVLRHDVLNDATVIRGHAELLRERTEGDASDHAEVVLERTDDLADEVERVKATIEALVGEDEPSLSAVDLSTVLTERVEELRSAYDVDVEASVPAGVSVRADDLLADVCWNLLTNAVEHTDAAPRVEVTLETDGAGTATVRVADDGPGVPDERKDAVFRRGDGDSGFGLFFVDTMVRRYGGDVWVEDNDPTGAVFVVELPTVDGTASGTGAETA